MFPLTLTGQESLQYTPVEHSAKLKSKALEIGEYLL